MKSYLKVHGAIEVKLNLAIFCGYIIYASFALSTEKSFPLSLLVNGLDEYSVEGSAYLIPESSQQLLPDLRKTIEKLEGFKPIDSILNDEPASLFWWPAYVHFHPDLIKEERKSRQNKLDTGFKNKMITEAEYSRWVELLKYLNSSDIKPQNATMKNQFYIQRFEWNRYQRVVSGLLRNEIHYHEYIVLVDLSPVFGDKNNSYSLIWRGGVQIKETKKGFHLFESLVGVTALLSPGWNIEREKTEFVSSDLLQWFKNLGLKSSVESSNKGDILAKLNSTTNFPVANRPAELGDSIQLSLKTSTSVQTKIFLDSELLKLNTDQIRNSRLLPINPTEFLLVSNYNKSDIQMLKMNSDGIQNVPIYSSPDSMNYNYTELDGTSYFLTEKSDPNQDSYVRTFCWNKFDLNRKKSIAKEICFQNVLSPSIIRYSKNEFFALCSPHIMYPELKERIINLSTGQAEPLSSILNYRKELGQVIPRSEGNIFLSQPLNLGDGLLWLNSYAGIWGLDPKKRIARASFYLSNESFDGKNIFGSVKGDWLAFPKRHSSGPQVWHVITLSSGLTKFNLPSASLLEESATAHASNGLLFATFVKDYEQQINSVYIWDMENGDNLARIDIPKPFEFISMSFNSNGQSLWILTNDEKSQNTNVLIWNSVRK